MLSLSEWDDAAHGIERIYLEDLLRGPHEITIGEMANWLWHWREEGWDLETIRASIRSGPEYALKHGGVNPPVPPPIKPPPGPFRPPSGGLRAIHLTGDFIPRMYSYWPNAWVQDNDVYVFAGVRGQGPRFYRIDGGDNVTELGQLIPYGGETEGWYWSADGRVFILSGPQLHLVNPFNGDDQVVFDISDKYNNHDLWQAHSSDDGQVHVATVRERSGDTYPHVATVIAQGQRKTYVPALGKQDEAHVTSDGGFAIIEEDNNNRIVSVLTGAEQLILDADYALSHIDCGPGYMVGEDNIHGRAWKIELPSLMRTELEQTWGMGHVSVQNGRCLLSNAGSLFWMDLDGGGLSHILDHGMAVGPGDPYDYQVKANLDRMAVVAVYMTNNGNPNGKQDVVVLRF